MKLLIAATFIALALGLAGCAPPEVFNNPTQPYMSCVPVHAVHLCDHGLLVTDHGRIEQGKVPAPYCVVEVNNGFIAIQTSNTGVYLCQ